MIITIIKCICSSIQFKKGMFIHPLCSIQQQNDGKIHLSEGVILQSNTFIRAFGKGIVKLGKGCFLNAGTRVDSYNKITIKDNVIIGPYTYISDFNHEYIDVLQPIKNQKLTNGDINIESDSWIGAHCTIVGTINIGKHCVIGANSVVTCDIPDYCIAVGSPAKIIKKYDLIKKEWIRIG